jgi:pimeloyl-ACP methyl ester carboxylesterase
VNERHLVANGLDFALLEDGPADAPLALCLHGFPDSAHTWHRLLGELAAAGYHAVAPFMRGYAPTAAPKDTNYQTGALVRDVNRLHEALGADERAVVIGHDWGALAIYGALAHQPDRWRRAVTMSVPPPAALGESFFDYSQLKRSWYTFFFLSPLAELALPMRDFAFIGRLWSDWSPGFDATWYVERAKESIGTPKRMGGAISYYRQLYDASAHDPDLVAEQAAFNETSTRPTLYLHGRNDGCFSIEVIGDPTSVLAEGSEVGVIENAGHFLHLEQPDEVRDRVLAFLGAP